ncbi:MAG: enterochelin esterase [Deltaproteobacteria bacterium]|nr:enterochelin esterase [Deltaproteobacteria bacterium]
MIPTFPRDPWGRDITGKLHELNFESKLLAGNPLKDPSNRPLLVYTPPSWPAKGPYKSLWLLQGFTGQVDAWRNRSPFEPTLVERVDAAVRKGDMPEAVLVFVDAWSSYGGSQFVDSVGVGKYRSYLCDELVPFVTEKFQLKPTRESRALIGKSSGGYGAIMVALERAEVWGGFSAFAPDAAFEYAYLPDFPQAWKTLGKFDHDVAAFWTALRGKEKSTSDDHATVNTIAMAACYSPDAKGEPVMPFAREDASLRQDIWDRWLTFDPVRALPKRLAEARGLRAISIECGHRDQFRLYAGATMLNHQLEKAGIKHRFELFDGTHDGLQGRYPAAMAYLLERLA